MLVVPREGGRGRGGRSPPGGSSELDIIGGRGLPFIVAGTGVMYAYALATVSKGVRQALNDPFDDPQARRLARPFPRRRGARLGGALHRAAVPPSHRDAEPGAAGHDREDGGGLPRAHHGGGE